MHDLDLLQYFQNELWSLNYQQKFLPLCVIWTTPQFTGEKFKGHWQYVYGMCQTADFSESQRIF